MGILARLRLAKIRTMARPNSPDMMLLLGIIIDRNPCRTKMQLFHLKSAEWPLLFITRFGHTATPLSDSVVLLTGGFGLDNGKHMRLNGVQLLRTVQGNFLTILFLFFTVTKLLYLLNLLIC